MPIRLHHSAANAKPCSSIKEATFEDIGADEIDEGTEQPGQDAGLFAPLVVRLGT